MFDTVFGLPIHPLVVHATVVVVPAAAVSVGLAAVWPRFRAWAGALPLALAVLAVVLVPITTASGESLEQHVPRSVLLREHTRIAEGLLVPVLVLAAAAAALFWVYLRERAAVSRPGTTDAGTGAEATPSGTTSVIMTTTVIMTAATVLAVVGVLGTTVQVARIGHSGAKAAWSPSGR